MVIALGRLGSVLLATLNVASTSASAQSYVVKQGDTLTSIAQAFHTSVSALVSVNHLTNPDRLTVGEALVVGAPDAVSATSLSTVTAAGTMTYVVQAGDTLAELGRRFGLSEAALAAANGLVNPNRLSVGQTLVIVPAPTSQVPSVNTISPAGAAGSGTSTTTIYTVRAGDTLVALATRFNMTPSAIAAANGLVNPNLIIVGQPLVIAHLSHGHRQAQYHQQWPQARYRQR